jgi:hypothetical protein
MFSEQEIERYSNQYKCTCNVFHDTIYINSTYRNWICERRGQSYRLMHLNSKQCKHKNHMHEKPFTDIEEVFKFVSKHDTQVVPDRNRNKRLKLERLFNSIHK